MTDEADAATELAELCARERLTVVERFDSPTGAARFAAHVVDERGGHHFLKRGSGLRGKGEIAVLQAYAPTGHTPAHLRPIDAETFLSDWVDGVSLDHAVEHHADLLHQSGRVLRELHSVAVPGFPLMPIHERVSSPWVERDLGSALSGAMHRAAVAAARELSDYEAREAVVLHGDAVPGNILVSVDRICVIDPIGFSGPAAWDVAQLAVAVQGRDRRLNLADILAGYGGQLSRLEAAFAYLAFVFLAAHRQRARKEPGSQTALIAELDALARTLS